MCVNAVRYHAIQGNVTGDFLTGQQADQPRVTVVELITGKRSYFSDINNGKVFTHAELLNQ